MGKSKIITYVVVAVLVIVGLYWVYGLMTKTPELATGGVVVSTAGASGVVNENDQTNQYVAVLNEIDKIDLNNTSIFSNKIFTSFQDFGRAITDRPVGRVNPFSPFTAGAGTAVNKITPPNPGAGGTAGAGTSADQGGGDTRLDVLGE
ncbi:MAG: hypothetical protein NT041_01775 [Candidatus Vogelbacteria bacterium]|nr:hypothetical protein [Candidatus Vogelbacteria bacterium]